MDARTVCSSFIDPLLRATPPATAVLAANGRVLADRILPAFTWTSRLRGLLGRSSLPHGSAMILTRCCAVHTCFMKFRIDIVFLSRDGRVLKMRSNCGAWRFAAAGPAFAVIELPAGTIASCGVHVGDVVAIATMPAPAPPGA